MMMKEVFFLVMVMLSLLQLICIHTFASPQTNGTARTDNDFNKYSPCDGLEDEGIMVAVATDSLYRNGTGCGQMVVVTCVDAEGYSPCVSSYPVVVKLTYYCVRNGNCTHTLYLPEAAYSYMADPKGTLPIVITYELYTQDNYTQMYTLKQGEVRNLSAQPLVSANNLFSLETFTLSYYIIIAIFLRNGNRHPVWIGNRNNPMYSYENHAFLALESTNKFFLRGSTGEVIEMFYAGQRVSNISVTITLLDSGNLVLREMNLDGSIGKTLWQSFDYPTDTLLPGMKLGINHKTGKNWTLKSWSSDDTQRDGAFSLDWDPKGRALVFKHRGVMYWTSGMLMDSKRFEFLKPNDPSLYFTNVTNDDEEYFTYTLGKADGETKGTGIISAWTLDRSGRISVGNRPPILQEDFCSGYDSLDGCHLRVQPECRTSPPKFQMISGVFVGPGNVIVDGNAVGSETASAVDCKEECWRHCDCVANVYLWNESRCYLWRGKNLTFVQDNTYSAIKYILSTEEAPPPSHGKSKNWTWALVAVAVALVFLCFGLLWYLKKRKRRREEEEMQKRDDEYFLELTASESFKDVSHLESKGRKGSDVMIFSFASIVEATNDFSNENKLGQGGFGPVYKGILADGREIAIKRLSRTSGQGLVEFKNELILIAKLQHTNLVRILGCCIRGEEKMLIYEFMPNKGLDFFLFDEKKKELLDWPKRLSIIEGIAQGMLYLHKYSRMRVIHRDLKASNVLLDGDMNPKISDFGMARIFKPNETEAMTNRVVGTYGYMSPEYAMEGTFSEKSDVFSFGVMILEIVSGRRNSSFYNPDRPLNLIGYAWELWQQGNALELKDPALGDTCVINQLLRTVHVALLCVQESATDRPRMSDIISMLINDTMSIPVPKQPAFFTGRIMPEPISGESKSKECSENSMTITEMEGR